MPNRLAGETSPYLLQHANNPVDWHFAEGGREGPRKLQGYKVLDSRHAKMKTREIVRGLSDFLRQPSSGTMPQLEKAARDRALAVLRALSDKGSNHH